MSGTQLAHDIKDAMRERRLRAKYAPAPPAPLDVITRDTVVAEVKGTEPPPVIVPVLKKRRMRAE